MYWYFALGHLLSSAGQAIGSPLAGRASSVALLAAGVVVSVGKVLHASLYELWCLQVATDQCNFARDAPSDGLFIGFRLWLMVLLFGYWCVNFFGELPVALIS